MQERVFGKAIGSFGQNTLPLGPIAGKFAVMPHPEWSGVSLHLLNRKTMKISPNYSTISGFLHLLCVILLLTFSLSSCQSGTGAQDEGAAVAPDPTASSALVRGQATTEGDVQTLILHEVKDFGQWKAGFDAAVAERRAAGERSYEVGTLQEDPSVVYVFNNWQQEEDFRKLMSHLQQNDIMARAGVVGEPTFIVFDPVKHSDLRGNKIKTLIYHRVQDFAAWTEAFHGFADERRAAGELSYAYGHFSDDPSMVYVLNEWESAADFQAFIAKPELKRAMEGAGVVGPPQFIVFNEKDRSGT